MATNVKDLPWKVWWQLLSGAAVRALEENGCRMERTQSTGRSNVWKMERNGETKLASIRTTRDRWFAYQPQKGGTRWKTLDDVDVVVVATLDDRETPRNIEVYEFEAGEVRARFEAAYAARKAAGLTVTDNFGMWIALDKHLADAPAFVGSGLGIQDKRVASYPIAQLMADSGADSQAVPHDSGNVDKSGADDQQLNTIADVMDWARQRISSIAGVRIESVKLDCRIES